MYCVQCTVHSIIIHPLVTLIFIDIYFLVEGFLHIAYELFLFYQYLSYAWTLFFILQTMYLFCHAYYACDSPFAPPSYNSHLQYV